MSTDPCKKVILKSSDGETFEVSKAVAMESVTIKHIIEDTPDDDIRPIPNVKANLLAKVIEYCKKHVGIPSDAGDDVKTELEKFDAELVNGDYNALFDLVLAANYLNVPGLLDLTLQASADKIKDLQPDEVRKIFNIKNDFSEEEEAALREESKWAFE